MNNKRIEDFFFKTFQSQCKKRANKKNGTLNIEPTLKKSTIRAANCPEICSDKTQVNNRTWYLSRLLRYLILETNSWIKFTLIFHHYHTTKEYYFIQKVYQNIPNSTPIIYSIIYSFVIDIELLYPSDSLRLKRLNCLSDHCLFGLNLRWPFHSRLAF